MTRTDIRLRHNDLVLVADGSKALLMTNEGDAFAPRLMLEHVVEIDNPPTRDQGTERPGHFDKGGRTRRGAFEATDFHDAAENDFAARIAAMMEDRSSEWSKRSVVIVAAPRMLGQLRKHLSSAVRGHVSAELDVDLANKPVSEIEALLSVR
ncbi:host attachment protein [Acuticoccus kandeliae]|uniref:host attachment protein n=1 Tax=Acuticoccus kandeliae TaxID=2073160 RepID=UPI000D3E8C6F|nr:host attachment family protein [Acuticoccus kandeliae]